MLPKNRKEELSAHDQELVSQVQQLILALDKATRAQKLYMGNNPVLIQHRDRINALFKEFLSRHGELILTVQPEDFLYLGSSVYHNSNQKESFAFKLYNEGMRSIRFVEGVTAGEMDEFMNLLNTSWDVNPASASGPMLWEKEFEHISYVIAEYILDEVEEQIDAEVDGLTEPGMESYAGPTEIAASEDIEQAIETETLVPDSKFTAMAKNMFVLEPAEFEQIQREIANGEKHERLRIDLFDILITLILEETDPKELEELLQIFLETVDATVLNGELHIAAQFVSALRGQLEGGMGDFALRHPDRILRILDSLGSSERITRYLNSLNLGFSGTPKDIIDFFVALPKKSFPTLLGHLPVIDSPQLRRELAIAAAHLYDRDIAHFAKAFKTIKNQAHLLDVLFVLAQTRDARAVDFMTPLIHHDNRAVRLATIGAIRDLSAERGKNTLLAALEDSDEEIRSQAARVLGTSKERNIGMLMLEKVRGDNLYNLPLREKGSYFYAAARLLGDELIPYLKKLLDTRTFFRKQAMEEVYQCAAYALRAIGSEQASATLKHFEANGSKLVRQICAKELKKGQG